MWTREQLAVWADTAPQTLIDVVLALQHRIQALEGRLAHTSRNSSKPPASDGYLKPAPKSLRTKSGRKPGGQPGHLGSTLQPVTKPDHVVTHPLDRCPCGCGRSLRQQPVLRYETRQVFELPPQRLDVTEHRVEVTRCPRSGHEVCAPFPPGVNAPAQYGPRFTAWLVYCRVQQLLPLDRIRQMAADLFGHSVSEASVQAALGATATNLAAFRTELAHQLLQAAIVHPDETGLRVASRLHWLHVVSTPRLTWYGVHPKRGSDAIHAFGLLPAFRGRLIHDCWRPYFGLACAHGLCNAHLLRELTFLHEQLGQAWAARLHQLLLDMHRVVAARKQIAAGLAPAQRASWRRRDHAIVAQGCAANPVQLPQSPPHRRGRRKQTKAQNLLDRLQAHARSVLAFLDDFRVPFSNNQAEQDIRMVKVQQKISGSFRTLQGAHTFANVRSYISTVRKHGQDILPAITGALTGHPFIPPAPT